MAQRVKTQEEINEEKKIIVDASLNLFIAGGINALTMRKLSKKLNFSASKIYKYFYSKDEILLYLLVDAFKLLNAKLDVALNKNTPSIDIFINTYIDFSIEHPHHYILILNRLNPTFDTVASTSFKELYNEKNILENHPFSILKNIIHTLDNNLSDEELYIKTSRTLGEIHGIICLKSHNLCKSHSTKFEDVRLSFVESIMNEFGAKKALLK